MKDARVCVVDIGISNLTSVANALRSLSAEFAVSGDAAALREATHLILPGVGTFGAGMDALNRKKLVDPLREEVLDRGKKLFGICLGMQLLAEEGFEFGHNRGVGLIAGRVVKIDTSASNHKLPHMGWNNVDLRPGFRLTANLPPSPNFYFVHSFHFVPADPGVVAGTCDYGHDVVAMVEKGNVMGAQFHPEKSHVDGLAVLRNFLSAN